MHIGVSQGSVVGSLLFLLFVNDLPDVHKALRLLFADDVKKVTRRTRNMNPHISLTAALTVRRSGTYRSSLLSSNTSTLSEKLL